MRRQHGMPLHDERIMPYVQMAGLAHLARLNDHWFRLDEPLVSAFVERWRSETHTFHMPFGECTITLQDIAYHLGLPIDRQYVSSCLMDFERYIEGGRPAWTWFEKLLGCCTAGLLRQVHCKVHLDAGDIQSSSRARRREDMPMSCGQQARGEVGRTTAAPPVLDLLAIPGWSGYQLTSSEKGPRIAHCRLHIDLLRLGDFVWMPYSSPDVMQVVHPEILESRHTALWMSTTLPALTSIYFETY
ncbi:hypothetical protein Ahy_B10g105381 [Arachis hypogaea]|uniref:Aminotransferase-like plant mobile domain-containing protein n=1 Tax=Arachis hypogaea TaxID=3818 RepID=A0A444X7V4_ARAHY|nr:hypothetical protein Ahy_B10g105381 [Arachis hypogaea]